MENIIKYKNRKLYSRKISEYVNLNYIIDLVKSDQSFIVSEYTSNKDLTNLTLSEAILKINVNTDELKSLIKKGK